MRLLAGAVLVVILAGCGGGSSVQRDQEFLQLTGQDPSLSAVDAATRVQLGHDMCHLLAKHHGDAAAAGEEMGRGVESTLTPTVVSALSADAAVAYCPKYR